MSLREIILHLGASKTATTSFQGYFLEHEAEFAAQGIGRVNSLRMDYNDKWAGFYMGQPTWWKLKGSPIFRGLDQEEALSRVRDKFLEEARAIKKEKLLITYEGFLPRKEEEIQKFISLCREITPNISAIATIRRQDRWALSSYNTRLLQEVPISSNPLDSNRKGWFNRPKPAGMRYSVCLERWAKFISRDKFTVLAYEDHPNMLSAYFNAIGFVAETPSTEKRNTGMSAYGQEVLRLAGIREQQRGQTLKEIWPLLNVLKGIVPRGEGRRPSAAQAAAHLAYFKEDHSKLKGLWIPASSKFFENSHYPNEASAVTVDEEVLQVWINNARDLLSKYPVLNETSFIPGGSAWRLVDTISIGNLK